MTWIIGRKAPDRQPAACRHCGQACASAQGRASHERRCAQRPAPAAPEPEPATTPEAACAHCGSVGAPPSKRVPGWCRPCAIRAQLAGAPAPAPTPAPAPEPPSPGAVVRAYILANPEATPAEIIAALGASRSTVWKIRGAMVRSGEAAALKPGAPRAEGAPAPAPTCPTCGGPKQRRSARCQTCRVRATAEASFKAAGRAARRSPPLSTATRRALAACDDADDDAALERARRDLLRARARDWGLLARRREAA